MIGLVPIACSAITGAEIARIVKANGHVHLMDFASLKRQATARYFVHDRTAGLGAFLAADYENSLRAAYRVEDFEHLAASLRAKVPGARLQRTFGVPFLVALTSIQADLPDPARRAMLAHYWARMLPSQRADFDAMRLFFQLGELGVAQPLLLVLTEHALQQPRRNHLDAAQCHQTFNNEGNGNDRSQKQRPDGPTCSLNDGEHTSSQRKFSGEL